MSRESFFNESYENRDSFEGLRNSGNDGSFSTGSYGSRGSITSPKPLSSAGNDTWLRQTLLTSIVTYNKTMKGLNIGKRLMGTSSDALKAKRRETIRNALNSLMPENYQRTTGVPIEEAGITRSVGSFFQTGVNKAFGKQKGNEMGYDFGKTLSYNRGQSSLGGKKKRGTRRNKGKSRTLKRK